ncbi:MAG: hypothetical protein R2854_02055 [Caldilineaceae bacterium]
MLDKVGRLDRIDLILPPGDAETAARRHRADPAAGRAHRSCRRAQRHRQRDDRSLQPQPDRAELLALVVGVFLIYNTVTFSVVQRRPVLGSLRPGHDPTGNLRLDPAGSVDPRRVGDVAGSWRWAWCWDGVRCNW